MAKLATNENPPRRPAQFPESGSNAYRNRTSPQLAEIGESGVLLEPLQPFNFLQTLRFVLSPPALLNGRVFAPLLDYFEDGEYRRAVDISGQAVLYGVREVPGRPARLCVRILAGPRDATTESFVCRLVERQLSTALDLASFEKLAQSDRVLAKLWTRFRGMRIPQAVSVYETLVGAIIEQQVNLSFAHQVKKALIESFGKSVEYDGRRYNVFPEPAALAIATPRGLRRLQVSGPKAKYIIAISRAALDGTVDLESLRELDPPLVHTRLLEHKGVGPWTAQYVGLRALAHLDCLPSADVGLQKSIQRFYRLRKQPTVTRVERLARSWKGWRSYATFYLWLTYWETEAWKRQVIDELGRERREARAVSGRFSTTLPPP